MPVLSFTPFPKLETPRLVLRQLQSSDAGDIYALRSDKSVNAFLDRPMALSVREASDFIERTNAGIAANQWLLWALVPRGNTRLAGTICLWNIEKEKDKAELGYELLPAFQGKGFMQEAIPKIIEFGTINMQLKIIEAFTKAGNHRSVKLLEKNNFLRNIEAEASRDAKEKNMLIYTYAADS